MERIKQALEKAKSNQDRRVVSLDPAPSSWVEHASLVKEVSPAKVANEEVEYQQTPVVLLDDTHLEAERIVAHRKTHPASWSFDLLRTQVLQKMDENGWRTLAVTSPTMESGKTVVAVNLAISIAQQTDRTSLLVDFDLRRPRVAAALGLRPAVSLNQVLSCSASVGEAMVNPGLPRIVVLPTEHSIPGSAELLASSKVANLMSELRDRYSDRVVIVDLPPVLASDDVLAILPRVDCVLLVVGNGLSTQKEIEDSMGRLAKCHLVGVVLNKDDAPTRNQYY